VKLANGTPLGEAETAFQVDCHWLSRAAFESAAIPSYRAAWKVPSPFPSSTETLLEKSPKKGARATKWPELLMNA